MEPAIDRAAMVRELWHFSKDLDMLEPTRERSIAKTKIEEAAMWLRRDLGEY